MELPPYVLSDLFLVKSNGAHTTTFCPKAATQITSFQLMMHIENLFGAYTLQKPDQERPLIQEAVPGDGVFESRDRRSQFHYRFFAPLHFRCQFLEKWDAPVAYFIFRIFSSRKSCKVSLTS